jgi:hypothetical protein
MHPGSGRKEGGRVECHVGGTVRRIRKKLCRPGRGDGNRRVRLRGGSHADLAPGWAVSGRRQVRLSRRASGEVDRRCASGCEQADPCCERDLAGRDRECGKRRHGPSRRDQRDGRRRRPAQERTGADRCDRG